MNDMDCILLAVNEVQNKLDDPEASKTLFLPISQLEVDLQNLTAVNKGGDTLKLERSKNNIRSERKRPSASFKNTGIE